jgi:hypothetical protein
MTIEYSYVKGKLKSFDGDYVYCDQCESNGIPDQKIVMVYLGIRPVNEPGFIHIFEIYDYPIGTRKKLHAHKYDNKVIGRLVNGMSSRARRPLQ